MNKKFFIIDGHALVYRCYFAFIKNPRVTSSGFDTSAIYGFTNVIFEVLNIHKPEFLTVVFDTNVRTWRHNSFKEYKATRPKQPDVITSSFPYIKNILSAMNIKFYEKDGFEADDLAGTMTKLVSKDVDIFLFTSDKDYAQLVTYNVFLFRQLSDKKYHKLDKDYILKKYSIKNTDQVRDILALEGDTADNIPGIYGIGEKTAQKLVYKYSSVENIIDNIDSLEVSDKIKDSIKKNKNQLVLSKKLVTITTNVDFNFDIEDCIVKGFNNEKLTKIFTELEFNSFLKKILSFRIKNKEMYEQLSLF